MSDNPAEKIAKALESDLRNPALHPAPSAVKSNPGPTPPNSQMNGSEERHETETGTLWPVDNTPWGLKKKSGPVSGTVSGGTVKGNVDPEAPGAGDEGVQPN